MLERSDLDHDEACEKAISFVAATTGQLFSKLDPIKIGEYSRALAIGKEYGSRLMARAGIISEDKRRAVLDKIVEGYPSHEFIIDYHELDDMGFSVKSMDEESLKMLPSLFKAIPDLNQFIKVVKP